MKNDVLAGIRGFAFRPDGKQLVLIGPTGLVEIWNVATGQKAFSLGDLETEPGAIMALSADGSWLAQSGPTRVWDLDSQRLLLRLPDDGNLAWCFAWSPNKELLAVGSSNGGLVIWNVPKIRAQLAEIGLDW